MTSKTAIIIGAGPAGLTAAYELVTRTDIKPIVLEKTERIGGISCTVNFKGNRIDIGGHRFFSKSKRVLDWWLNVLPLQKVHEEQQKIMYQNSAFTMTVDTHGPDPEQTDTVMLLRERNSRILFLRKLFDYPISLSAKTLKNLGLWRTFKIGISYTYSSLFPIRPEKNLEEFFINRFGHELYSTFFKSYTEKVWGVPCHQISAEWGAQRIKGLSVWRAISHALSRIFKTRKRVVETSLIEQFMYPKYGPGQMWEEVARLIREKGGEVHTEMDVIKLNHSDLKVSSVDALERKSGNTRSFEADYIFSTMPVKEIVTALSIEGQEEQEIAAGLQYRDFITVGLLVNKLKLKDRDSKAEKLIKDNWIYVQEPDVLVGRLQLFNNWSPYMVANKEQIWLGLEYFCYENDEVWSRPDKAMIELGIEELVRIQIIDREDVQDATVIRIPKAYPAYFGTYDRFNTLQKCLDRFDNLFLIGRNGQHRYNNQDHSMLAAMTAVDNIIAGKKDKDNVWAVNTESDYHEEGSSR